MKCEKCGAEIPDGNLYCENCGEEIHIVPVFEPDLETQIDEAMHRIQDDVAEQFETATPRRRKKKHHFLAWIIVLVIISIMAGIFALTYLYKSPAYQINWGHRYADNGEYLEAIECYERALTGGATEPVLIYQYMTKCYELLGYEGQYEEYLLKIIRHPQATEDDLLLAYTKLISFYSNDKNYNTINSLLKSCDNDKIISMYADFMVSQPKFSHEPGYYKEIIPLKISSSKGDTVYYTTDGSTPTTESTVYSTPIFLESGEYEIRAICVDKNGVVSDVVVGQYQIDF